MLIIFDCDGVLVDSEKLAAQVFADALAERGLAITAQTCFSVFKGHTLANCFEILRTQFAFEVPPDFAQQLDIKTKHAFTHNLKPVAGVRELLADLVKRGVPFCVASNGGHDKIAHSLTVTGLIKYFPENRFSAEDVARGKPAPDLFVYAAEAMGVPVEFARVIEDSYTGLKAARAAGIKSFFYGASSKECDQLEAIQFDNMALLPGLL
ncbi:HAD family hydrolase [Saccharophagus degradans]|uniref:HAD-superfamily hydrolase subfamily IA, variant 3 n=1 Tax=Saccharophagus degradans (strain 2-40 / ATCC 43961 / DSM 17024) TaxID=203122 RepID=Q21FA7_SACD2|nr:HAD-IA family hydrolase [Saccharophagus degradans]ABD82622.1 HAD-superfamily hydrolase subfamily IA, variant 3 [Saccharophagus degradans 2-40]